MFPVSLGTIVSLMDVLKMGTIVEFEARIKLYYRHVENYDWTRAADNFGGLETLFHRARSREILRLLKSNTPCPKDFVDFGCGTALITRHLGPGAVGLDLNPRNLEKAQHYAPEALFINCDVEGAVPLPDNSFDVAVCTEMLEHLAHPEHAVAEMHRVLRQGGILVGSVPGRSLVWKMRRLSSSRKAFTKEPYHYHYRGEEINSLISACFSVLHLYSKHLEMNWYFIAVKDLKA